MKQNPLNTMPNNEWELLEQMENGSDSILRVTKILIVQLVLLFIIHYADFFLYKFE